MRKKGSSIWDGKHDEESLVGMAGQYLKWLVQKNYSRQTLKSRRYYLGRFVEWCRRQGLNRPGELTQEHIEKYQRYLVDFDSEKSGGKLSATNRYNNLKVTSLLFEWLLGQGRVLYNPLKTIEYPRCEERLGGNVLTASEVERILSEIDVGSPLGVRDRAMLEMLYSTGMRGSELVALEMTGLDLQKATVMVVEGKGKKDRLVPIGERALKWVEKYLGQVRPRLAKSEHRLLFVTYYGKGFGSQQSLGHLIGRYKKAAQIETKGASHLFRRSMATLMLKNGADIRYIQEILGHESIKTTELYTRVNIEHLKAVHRKTHPAEERGQECRAEEVAPGPRQLSSRARVSVGESIYRLKIHSNAPGDLIDLAQKYLLWMKGHFVPLSIDTRSRHLNIFLDWCADRGIIGPGQLTKTIVERYSTYLIQVENKHHGGPLSAPSRVKRMGAVKGFCTWLVKGGHLLYDPAGHIPVPKVPKRLPRNVLTAEEIERVLSQPQINTILGVRDRAILETLYSTGIRRIECARLRIGDIRFEEGTALIEQGKGRKDRYVPIGKRALYWIEEYLHKARPLLILGSEDRTLFFTKYGLAFTARGIGEVVRDHIKAANIGKTGACHILRHTMATLMLENGADIRYIQEILGHKNLETTQIYTKVSINKLKEVHAKTHPATMHPTKTEKTLDELEETR